MSDMTQTKAHAKTAAGVIESLSSNVVADKLNVTLANAIVNYQKLHHYHWQVRGEQFFRLHEEFEKLYLRFSEILDDVAERVLTIGGSPIGTLKTALEVAEVTEDSRVPSSREMVQSVLNDLALQRNQMQLVIEEAEKAGDRGAANMLDDMGEDLEKRMWMLRSMLK